MSATLHSKKLRYVKYAFVLKTAYREEIISIKQTCKEFVGKFICHYALCKKCNSHVNSKSRPILTINVRNIYRDVRLVSSSSSRQALKTCACIAVQSLLSSCIAADVVIVIGSSTRRPFMFFLMPSLTDRCLLLLLLPLVLLLQLDLTTGNPRRTRLQYTVET